MTWTQTSIAVFFAAAVGAAPGCKKDQDAEREPAAAPAGDEAAEATEATEPAPKDRAPDEAAAAEPASYELSATQVGPLAADMSVTAEQLRTLFPDAEVSATTAMAEGTEYEVVEVALGGEDALVVSPRPDGTIDRVRITSDRFRLPGGVGIGSAFEELRALGELACTGGADDYGDSVLCRPESAPTLAFVLEAQEADDYYAKPVPPEAQGKLLTGKKVDEILWQPAR